jgi:three-Cys-motif partner protein
MRYDSFRKGLLLLDPYGLDVDWRVIEAAGRSRCVDLLLNFPIMDMNRSVLHHDRSTVSAADLERMDTFWGNRDAWDKAAYQVQGGLFGDALALKRRNEPVVEAYRTRLKEVAGYPHVSTALPMSNDQGSPLYYLIGASQKEVGRRVFDAVFSKRRKARRSRRG